MDNHNVSELLMQQTNSPKNPALHTTAPTQPISVPATRTVHIASTPVSAPAVVSAQSGLSAVVAVAAAASDTLVDSNYYNFFGFKISPWTLYIFLAFVGIVIAYYIFKYFTASPAQDKPKKRAQVVSYDQQPKTEDETQIDESE